MTTLADLCTCPTEGEWRIHIPNCGDRAWTEIHEPNPTKETSA